jgi:phosphoribosylformylglycinamidine cyclo-ligase
MSDTYARAGVDTGEAARGVRALVDVLARIDTGRASRSVLGSGHYASVLEIAPGLGLALCIDGVGSKVIVAEQAGRFDTVGIDCVAMNANDLVCVGAEPIALLDYLAVEQAEPAMLEQIAEGLRLGAEQAGVEIPGGELAQLPELIRGHPSPSGFDLVGACVGTVALDELVTGERCSVGDSILGLPSSGVHSNGLTLARRALLEEGGLSLDDSPHELGGESVADVLLEPTVMYVRGVLDLLRSDVTVHGLAHITGEGVLNLLRLNDGVGFEIDTPLPVPAVFDLIARLGDVPAADMWRTFNMGCGLCAVVASGDEAQAVAVLSERHPGTARIGCVTGEAGRVALPRLGLAGGADGLVSESLAG